MGKAHVRRFKAREKASQAGDGIRAKGGRTAVTQSAGIVVMDKHDSRTCTPADGVNAGNDHISAAGLCEAGSEITTMHGRSIAADTAASCISAWD